MQNVNSVEWIDLHPLEIDFRAEVIAGLTSRPKRLAAKFFYDQRGSELFEEITRLPEYYLTRTELAILTGHATEMVDHFGREFALIEFGSGSSTKVRLLLDASRHAGAYMPVDISARFLRTSAETLAAEYPDLVVSAVYADYTRLDSLPDPGVKGRRIVFFPGSTVGNLDPDEAREFFGRTSRILERGDGLLIGADTRKDPAVLHAAYNDSRGVTAEFNLNILERVRRELGGTLDPSRFEHVAFFNQDASRIEMHLRTDFAHSAMVDEVEIAFEPGESIHTENSYKYDDASFRALFAHSRFRMKQSWTDEQRMFGVHYLEIE